MTAQPSPFSSPAVQAALKAQHETETETIVLLAWSGSAHRWTWTLHRAGKREMFCEIPQPPDPLYAIDQAVLADIFKLYPESAWLFCHGQTLSLWPSLKCIFKRVPHGSRTRLQLVGFEEMTRDRVHEVERHEQALRLHLLHWANAQNVKATAQEVFVLVRDNPQLEFEELCEALRGVRDMTDKVEEQVDVETSATEEQTVVDQQKELDDWFQRKAEDKAADGVDELTGKPDPATAPAVDEKKNGREPLVGRINTKSEALHHIPGHIKKHLGIKDNGEVGKIVRTIFGKPIGDFFPPVPDPHKEGAGDKERRETRENELAQQAARMVDVYMENAMARKQLEQAEAQQTITTPPHWSEQADWVDALNNLKARRKETAIMINAEWQALCHKILEVSEYKLCTIDRESALAKLKIGIAEHFKDKWWERPEAIAALEQKLNDTGLPEQLGIAPSEVMAHALKTAKMKDLAEWAQGGGNTGQQFFLYATKMWGAEVKALKVTDDVEPEQAAQAPSTPVEPPPTPDVQNAPESKPAVNGNGQDSPIAQSKPNGTSQSLTVIPNTGIATLPMVAQWEIMRQQADVLIKSGFLPKSVDTAEKAIAIMMMGNALGVEPIVALQMINVIAGKPTVSPQLQMALIWRSGQLERMETSDDGHTCTVVMRRRGQPTHTETFSMDDAQRLTTTEWENNTKRTIPLSQKKNWKEQPAVMRKWRAIAAACRVVFPDVVLGIAAYTTEEIDPDTVIEAEVA